MPLPDTIKISVNDLDEKLIEDIKERYGGAELSIVINQQSDYQSLTEEEFWSLIELLDWNQSDNEAIITPLVETLATHPVGHIYQFQEFLAQKLYSLDQQIYAEQIGRFAYREGDYFSADHFLHVRACVVANGKAAYEEILKSPPAMFKDISFEPLLKVASLAYESATGKNFIYVPTKNIDTYSNKAGWAV
ncbi:MAG: DUF4240 domain-containing protein [Bacteroidota bacterium]